MSTSLLVLRAMLPPVASSIYACHAVAIKRAQSLLKESGTRGRRVRSRADDCPDSYLRSTMPIDAHASTRPRDVQRSCVRRLRPMPVLSTLPARRRFIRLSVRA